MALLNSKTIQPQRTFKTPRLLGCFSVCLVIDITTPVQKGSRLLLLSKRCTEHSNLVFMKCIWSVKRWNLRQRAWGNGLHLSFNLVIRAVTFNLLRAESKTLCVFRNQGSTMFTACMLEQGSLTTSRFFRNDLPAMIDRSFRLAVCGAKECQSHL